MLTISKPLSAGQAQTYHQKEFTAKEQSYWSQGNAVQGEWQGRLAAQYGLSGIVTEEEFARLAQGQHPKTGGQLVRHRIACEYKNQNEKAVTSMEHRAGWDATFSTPKSVSLTALVGGDHRIRDAHRESVRIALGELERYVQARIGGNYPAETTGKFIVAKFEHDTARPVKGYAAPQLHTHAVVFNITERESGGTRAIQPRGLFQSQQFATAVYQSELTYRLRRLGYEIVRGRSGAPEIKGYTQEYLDASSPRSQQIREYLQKIGHNSKESAEIAAHSTRDRKEILSPREVLAAHRRLAADFGNQADIVVRAARERARELRMPSDSVKRAQESVTFARDRNFEREAVVDDRLLVRDALRRGMGEVRYSEVRDVIERRLASGELVHVQGRPHATGKLLTTSRTIAAEKDVLRRMKEGKNEVEPVAFRWVAVTAVDQHPYLNSAQKAVIEDVLTSTDRIQGIQGIAGAGKTTTLRVIRSAAEENGYKVEGFAPTSRAAKQLGEAGIQSGTLQSFLARTQGRATESEQKRFFFVDESSLASTKHMRQFLQRIASQDRVLLVGDIRQHQGVEAGRPFEQLQEAGMRTAKLDQIVRQKDPALKATIELLAQGRTAAAIDNLLERGKVKEIANSQERLREMARNFVANPKGTLIISADNSSRQELNQAVRHELKTAGTLTENGPTFRVLVPRQDMTGADRAWAGNYHVEDVVRYSRGSKVAGIGAGSYGKVVSTNPVDNLLTVLKPNGDQCSYDPKRLAGVSVYSEVEREFCTGDRIQFTAPVKELGIANRELATIESIEASGIISLRLEGDRTVRIDANGIRHFDHGYAVTSYSSQGLTAERVLVNVDITGNPNLVNTRFAYVALSRASMDAEIYTNDSSGLGHKLAHDVAKSAAVEFSQSVDHSVGGQGLSQSL